MAANAATLAPLSASTTPHAIRVRDRRAQRCTRRRRARTDAGVWAVAADHADESVSGAGPSRAGRSSGPVAGSPRTSSLVGPAAGSVAAGFASICSETPPERTPAPAGASREAAAFSGSTGEAGCEASPPPPPARATDRRRRRLDRPTAYGRRPGPADQPRSGSSRTPVQRLSAQRARSRRGATAPHRSDASAHRRTEPLPPSRPARPPRRASSPASRCLLASWEPPCSTGCGAPHRRGSGKAC